MLLRLFTSNPGVLRDAVLIAAFALPSSFALADGGPFEDYAGAWTGGGSITSSNGNTERIRCRAHYYVAQEGRDLNQQLRCASDSYHFDVNSALLEQGAGAVVGNWSETNRNASGSVSGQVQGGSVRAHIVGAGFTAEMTVVMSGDRQLVRIAPSGSEITLVTIEMRRE
jgi:hypothetical protein